MNNLLIGCHVRMAGPKYLENSVNDAIEFGANCMMFYTGAPQNTRRTPIEKLHVNEMLKIWNENEMESMIVHAPYIINLANTIDLSKSEFGVKFLIEELNRVNEIGAKVVVLHPGSHVKAGLEIGLDQIVKNLDLVFESTKNMDVKIALETMAGKGSECCFKFDQLKYVIENSKFSNRLGICLDTCHIFDAGYDIVNDLEGVIEEFKENGLLEKLLVIHLNDSKNTLGSKKDRHENIGFGNIGFDTLVKVAHHLSFSNIPKILETPYVDDKPIYKKEIEMLKSKIFDSNFRDNIK